MHACYCGCGCSHASFRVSCGLAQLEDKVFIEHLPRAAQPSYYTYGVARTVTVTCARVGAWIWIRDRERDREQGYLTRKNTA